MMLLSYGDDWWRVYHSVTWSGFSPAVCISHIRLKRRSKLWAYVLQSKRGESVLAFHTLARMAFKLQGSNG